MAVGICDFGPMDQITVHVVGGAVPRVMTYHGLGLIEIEAKLRSMGYGIAMFIVPEPPLRPLPKTTFTIKIVDGVDRALRKDR